VLHSLLFVRSGLVVSSLFLVCRFRFHALIVGVISRDRLYSSRDGANGYGHLSEQWSFHGDRDITSFPRSETIALRRAQRVLAGCPRPGVVSTNVSFHSDQFV